MARKRQGNPTKTTPGPADASAGPRAPRRLWKKVALAAASTVFALVMTEGAVRLLRLAPQVRAVEVSQPNSDYRWSDNPVLGYELRPGIPGVNSHGQRDIERTVEKRPGVRRIFVVGDSVAEGRDVDRVDDIISREFERLYSDGNTEVLNFAVGGYCTRGEVELLKARGLAFHPDIVIIVFVVNDWDNFNGDVGLFMTPPRPRIVNQAFRSSHLFRLMCLKLDLFRFSGSADPARRNAKAIGDGSVNGGLRLLKELSLQHGFQPWIAVWPVFSDDGVVDPQVVKGSNQLLIEALAENEGIPTYRISEYFQKVLKEAKPGRTVNPKKDFTIGDGMHPNVEGSRIAAKALKAMLDHGPVVAQMAASRKLSEAECQAAMKGSLGAQKQYTYVDALLHAAAMSQDDPAQAFNYYKAVLQLEPKDAEVCCSIGYQLAKMGRLGGALAACQRALSLEPSSAAAHNVMGFVLARMDKTHEALAQFRETIRLDPKHADAHVNAGMLLLQQGNVKEARALMTRALELRPGDPGALRGLQAVQEAEKSPAPAAKP